MENSLMQNGNKTEAGKILYSENILFDEFCLSQPVHTAIEVADKCKCEIKQVVKTLLFIGETNSVLIVLSGDKRVNLESLSSRINQKIKMATPKQVLAITSYTVGSVSPFLKTYPQDLILFADDSLLSIDKLYLGSGDLRILLTMSSSEFSKAFKGTFLKI